MGAAEKLWRGAGQGQADVVWNSLGEMSVGRDEAEIQGAPGREKRPVGQIRIENSGLVGRALPQRETCRSEAG